MENQSRHRDHDGNFCFGSACTFDPSGRCFVAIVVWVGDADTNCDTTLTHGYFHFNYTPGLYANVRYIILSCLYDQRKVTAGECV